MKTLQDRFLEALTKSGETVVKQLIGCIVVSRKEGGYYYLGKAGGLRYGATRQSSIPCSNRIRQLLLTGFNPDNVAGYHPDQSDTEKKKRNS